MTTLMGKSKSWWHRRLDFIFTIADEGEDIPFKALTYGVQGKVTVQDIEWAEEQIARIKEEKENEGMDGRLQG